MADRPKIDPKKVGQFQKIKIWKFDNKKIYSILPTDFLVFYVWGQNFNFFFFFYKFLDCRALLVSVKGKVKGDNPILADELVK